ncbi:hypothetical protein D9M71_681640 [compost metagenome]
MAGPGFFLGGAARNDRHGAVAAVDLHAHALARLGVQHQRAVNFKLFDVDELTRLVALRGRQHQLGETGAGEQHGVADLMVFKGREQLRVQATVPGQFVAGYRMTQQWMHTV